MKEEETKRSDYLDPITPAQAILLWSKEINVFILHDDDTESLIETAEDLAFCIEQRFDLRMEKVDLPTLQKILEELEQRP